MKTSLKIGAVIALAVGALAAKPLAKTVENAKTKARDKAYREMKSVRAQECEQALKIVTNRNLPDKDRINALVTLGDYDKALRQ